mgnify:CR=1 FL=1
MLNIINPNIQIYRAKRIINNVEYYIIPAGFGCSNPNCSLDMPKCKVCNRTAGKGDGLIKVNNNNQLTIL